MLELTCKYCGIVKRVKPSDVNNPEDYHCRHCHHIYLKEKRENGEVIWDRSHLNKINKLAILHQKRNIVEANIK